MNINRLFLPVFLLGIGAVFYLHQRLSAPPGGLRDATASLPAAPASASAPSAEERSEAAPAADRPAKARTRKRYVVSFQLGKDRKEPSGTELLEDIYSDR